MKVNISEGTHLKVVSWSADSNTLSRSVNVIHTSLRLKKVTDIYVLLLNYGYNEDVSSSYSRYDIIIYIYIYIYILII